MLHRILLQFSNENDSLELKIIYIQFSHQILIYVKPWRWFNMAKENLIIQTAVNPFQIGLEISWNTQLYHLVCYPLRQDAFFAASISNWFGAARGSTPAASVRSTRGKNRLMPRELAASVLPA
jgi:hypothetical protein